MKRYDAKINRENIDYHINEIKENGFNDLLKVFNNEKYLKLKYELFYNDFEVIYKAIEDFFNIKISKQTKEKLNKAYNTDEVIKKTSKFENFEDYDKDNFFHGKHVSDTKGSPYAFKDYFNQEDLTYIENELNPIIKKLEY